MTSILMDAAGVEGLEQFLIENDTLKIAEQMTADAGTQFTIRVQTDDGNVGQFQKSFIISVIDTGAAVRQVSGNELFHHASQPHHQSQPLIKQRCLLGVELSRPFRQKHFIEGNYLRYIDDRIHFKTGSLFREQKITGCARKAHD